MLWLGHTRFVAQGADWGGMITDVMGTQAPPELLGIHLNWVFAVPPDIDKAIQTGSPLPTDLSADERRACDQLAFFYQKGVGYALEMANRPQTLYGLADSPVGLAAFLLDHDAKSLKLISRVFDGQREGLTQDDVLDNITLYWLTSTAISSARIYRENKDSFFEPKGVVIPVAVSASPSPIERRLRDRAVLRRAWDTHGRYSRVHCASMLIATRLIATSCQPRSLASSRVACVPTG